MADKRRLNRRNPNAERLTFVFELDCCPKCGERLGTEGSAARTKPCKLWAATLTWLLTTGCVRIPNVASLARTFTLWGT